MKLFPRCFPAAVALLTLVTPLHADEPKSATPAPSPAPLPAMQAKWNVRVEVLMVALPEEKAFALLGDLGDDSKVDGAYAQLMEAIKHKEGKLVGYPIVYTDEGHRGSSATNVEKIYPTQFDGRNSPTNFEKRNLGPALEAECQVSASGEWIQVDLLIQWTDLLKFDVYATGARTTALSTVEQPLFFSARDTQHLTLHNGQRLLVGVHPLTEPEGEIELFVLQATAKAAR